MPRSNSPPSAAATVTVNVAVSNGGGLLSKPTSPPPASTTTFKPLGLADFQDFTYRSEHFIQHACMPKCTHNVMYGATNLYLYSIQ